MRHFVFGLLAAAALPAAAQAVTIANGSFEQGTNPGSFTTVGVGQTNIAGWDVLAGSVDYIGSYWTASDGNRSVDLSGNAIGKLGQTITGLSNGASYRVTFDVSRNPDGGVLPRTGTFTAGGQSFGFSYTDGTSNRSDMKWQTVSYVFTANGTSAQISFASDASGGCCFGPALDNVSIAPIPEPATWAMMLGGFGLLGAAARRRSGKAVLA